MKVTTVKVEPMIQIEMTRDEARTLLCLSQKISGCVEESRRGHVARLGRLLQDFGLDYSSEWATGIINFEKGGLE